MLPELSDGRGVGRGNTISEPRGLVTAKRNIRRRGHRAVGLQGRAKRRGERRNRRSVFVVADGLAVGGCRREPR